MSSYMDKREGEFLKHVAPDFFTEVYIRVRDNARKKHQELITRVEKYQRYNDTFNRRKENGIKYYEWESYERELADAKEYLERYTAANADYLV